MAHRSSLQSLLGASEHAAYARMVASRALGMPFGPPDPAGRLPFVHAGYFLVDGGCFLVDGVSVPGDALDLFRALCEVERTSYMRSVVRLLEAWR